MLPPPPKAPAPNSPGVNPPPKPPPNWPVKLPPPNCPGLKLPVPLPVKPNPVGAVGVKLQSTSVNVWLIDASVCVIVVFRFASVWAMALPMF